MSGKRNAYARRRHTDTAGICSCGAKFWFDGETEDFRFCEKCRKNMAGVVRGEFLSTGQVRRARSDG